ncbi:Hypothetical protein NTJ_08520 [Nesidiocoris tenuis]|uniref:MICOS complex subunit MIC13 n=1 Tax=Nesidiocoris tenuis TaxID=355587 RepID=A0ABN7AU50_9HEMI|nr:Hypothetical protein NTJ_08520 [Nesidiocoris tenuis]
MARLVKWGVKLGIVGAAVHYTNESGVWKDSSDTEKLYKDIHTAISPLFEDVPVEVPDIPKAGDISRAIVDGWNAGVLHSADFIAHLPTHTYNAAISSYEWINAQTNATSSPTS